MEVKQINQLMLAMGRYGINRLVLKREGVEVEIERHPEKGERSNMRYEPLPDFTDENPMRSDFEKHRSSNPVVQEGGKAIKALTDKALADDEASLFVTSPMVGTYYSSPSPQDPSFVKVGDRIEKNTVVCIIEAMKVMNEVKAGLSGTIAEILLDSAHPVEFGTKIFRIIPS